MGSAVHVNNFLDHSRIPPGIFISMKSPPALSHRPVGYDNVTLCGCSLACEEREREFREMQWNERWTVNVAVGL